MLNNALANFDFLNFPFILDMGIQFSEMLHRADTMNFANVSENVLPPSSGSKNN
jgi:hypothetical protein